MRQRRYFLLSEAARIRILKLRSTRLTRESGCHILRAKLVKPQMPFARGRMNGKPLICFALLVGALTVCGPAFAHHGAAAYANNIVVLKETTVTKFVWANPHTILLFD